MNGRCLVWMRIGYKVPLALKEYFVTQARVIMAEDLDWHDIPSW